MYKVIFIICMSIISAIVYIVLSSTANIWVSVEETRKGEGFMYIVSTNELEEVKVHFSDMVQVQSWELTNGQCSLDGLILHCTNMYKPATTIKVIVLTVTEVCKNTVFGASIEGFPSSFALVRNEPIRDCDEWEKDYFPYLREGA